MKKYTLILVLILFFHIAYTQEEVQPIVTDRPDQTESPVTVPNKSFQIESGFTFGWDKQDGVETRDLGLNNSLFRYGVLTRFEVRLGLAFSGYKTTDEATGVETSLNGMIPLMVGFKWNILYGDGPIPDIAFMSMVNIPPLASKDYSDGNVIQSFRLAGGWKLSNTFNFAFNIGSRVDWKQSNWTPIYSGALGINIIKWLGAFVEFYSIHPDGEYSDHRFDMGFTFPVRHNLQFDISGGVGLSKNSPDGFAGFGFAWRIPR